MISSSQLNWLFFGDDPLLLLLLWILHALRSNDKMQWFINRINDDTHLLGRHSYIPRTVSTMATNNQLLRQIIMIRRILLSLLFLPPTPHRTIRVQYCSDVFIIVMNLLRYNIQLNRKGSICDRIVSVLLLALGCVMTSGCDDFGVWWLRSVIQYHRIEVCLWIWLRLLDTWRATAGIFVGVWVNSSIFSIKLVSFRFVSFHFVSNWLSLTLTLLLFLQYRYWCCFCCWIHFQVGMIFDHHFSSMIVNR